MEKSHDLTAGLRHIGTLLERYPALAGMRPELERAVAMLVDSVARGGKVLTAGNGGSFADAEHITGELLKGFCKKRPLPEAAVAEFGRLWGSEGAELARRLQMGIPAVNLSLAPALTTAFGNDVDPALAVAQNLWASGTPGDVLIAISTGGNAANIRLALMAARVREVQTILLTGAKHGVCEKYADCVLAAPDCETYRIQELHLPIYHALCLAVEEAFFHE